MPAVVTKLKREDLVQEISDVIRQWPELDQRIFARAHYQGQSPEEISQSIQLDAKEVDSILRQCDRRLYASLRSFRKSSGEKNIPAAEVSLAPSCQKDIRVAPILGSGLIRIPEAYRKSA